MQGRISSRTFSFALRTKYRDPKEATCMTRVEQITTEQQYQQALAIRTEVFIVEQQVPVELEVDEYEQVATHVLAYDESGEAVAAGRILPYGDGVGKMQRIAVLKNARTGGYGTAIMN